MYHKEIQIKNKGVLAKIDVMAQSVLRLPHSFIKHPIPRTDLRGLINEMNDENHNGVGKSNGIDYANRYMTDQWWKSSESTRIAFKTLILDKKPTSWNSCHVLPPEWGAIGWHNSVGDPRYSIRFIWNSGNGSLLWNKGHHIQQIQHKRYPAGQKNWTCIAGYMDESTYVAIKNTGDQPCVVFDLKILPKHQAQFNKCVEFISSYQ
jgi:hypothetical protein